MFALPNLSAATGLAFTILTITKGFNGQLDAE